MRRWNESGPRITTPRTTVVEARHIYIHIEKDYFRILTIYSNMYHTPEKRPLQGSIKHYEDMIHRDLEKRGSNCSITKIADVSHGNDLYSSLY